MTAVDEDRDDPSEVEIANQALGRLGARRITSFADGTTEAEAARMYYYSARDRLLEHYTWDFAVQMVQLAADITPPLFNRAAKFALPADFMRLMRPFVEANPSGFDLIIQSGFIYTNMSAPINLRYVAQIEDVTRFSPSFHDALVLKLAHDMCEMLTQSNTKKDLLAREFKDVIADARRIKAIQAPAIDAPTDEWLTVRGDYGPGPASGFEY